MENDGTTRILVILGIVLAVLLFLAIQGTKEYYGGQVKKIRRIPFNSCAQICNGYLRKCLADNYSTGDTMWCHERFGSQGACVSECFYSNHHRF